MVMVAKEAIFHGDRTVNVSNVAGNIPVTPAAQAVLGAIRHLGAIQLVTNAATKFLIRRVEANGLITRDARWRFLRYGFRTRCIRCVRCWACGYGQRG